VRRERKRLNHLTKREFKERGTNLARALGIKIKRKDIIAAKLSQIVDPSLWVKLKQWLGKTILQIMYVVD
jgi:hypothetical protein